MESAVGTPLRPAALVVDRLAAVPGREGRLTHLELLPPRVARSTAWPAWAVSGTTTRDLFALRNWGLASGGATVSSFSPPDLSGNGCGPAGAIDGSFTTGNTLKPGTYTLVVTRSGYTFTVPAATITVGPSSTSNVIHATAPPSLSTGTTPRLQQ